MKAIKIEYKGGVTVDGKYYKLIFTKNPPELDMRYKVNKDYFKKK